MRESTQVDSEAEVITGADYEFELYSLMRKYGVKHYLVCTVGESDEVSVTAPSKENVNKTLVEMLQGHFF